MGGRLVETQLTQAPTETTGRAQPADLDLGVPALIVEQYR